METYSSFGGSLLRLIPWSSTLSMVECEQSAVKQEAALNNDNIVSCLSGDVYGRI